jgi:hypothetical protein
VTHPVSVPPVPVITAVRTAPHTGCGYDRLVFDINGVTPGYTVRYVPQVTADPSGKPITLPSHAFALITIRPAQAHGNSGTPTLSRQVQSVNDPMLKGYALAGDFEGAVSFGVGLSHITGIRVGELPARLYVDVQE